MHNVPADLHYTTSHEWVRHDGDGAVTVGITDHAQALLGELVFIELPGDDDAIKQGEECCVVESVKAASDVYAPLSGDIIAENAALDADPGLVNRDPYGEGWLFKLNLADPDELAGLMDAEHYQQAIDSEAH